MTTMARTITALLALAAVAGVAVAADDSNIGSRHAVDLKKVIRTENCKCIIKEWSTHICFCYIVIGKQAICIFFWFDDFTVSKRSVK